MPSPQVRRGHRVLKARKSDEKQLWSRLHKLADSHRPAFKRGFLHSVQAMQANLSREDLVRALGSARGVKAVQDLVASVPVLKAGPVDPASVNEMTSYYQSVLYSAAKEAFVDLEGQLPDLGQPFFTLTMSSPLVTKYAKEMAGKLITNVGEETRSAVREIVAMASKVGMHPYQQADLIKHLVGLLPRQAQAVLNYATNLDPGLPTAKADKLIFDLADRYLDDRAEMIARTETMSAANMGVRMGGEQLLELPFFSPEDLTYVWITTPDDRLCDECDAMDGEISEADGAFSSGDDSPPLHPNCRCAIARRVPDVDELQAKIDAYDASSTPDGGTEEG